MGIPQAVRVINRMVKAGVIRRYAIGGSVAAALYVEVKRTDDLDIYVDFPKGTLIATLDPLYDWLRANGHGEFSGMYAVIEGVPVQFLPVSGALIEEAVKNAVTKRIGDTRAKAFSGEYTVAIALELLRPDKDLPRIRSFMLTKYSRPKLKVILNRFKLVDKWNKIAFDLQKDS